ncbi:MAG TPA: Rrf2 family transcriptional regulator [Hellea balneolensis]|uniref:Rrf2 family transcriptional regulator n=1 Tax=Hellea balneolensis TaxID=287478 RepID=A0A7C3GLT5_9PROT|nr:Rrf2 family transcriptional regulator [Hellea balneolensis]
MKLTAKARYAVMAVTDIAVTCQRRLVRDAEAPNQAVSLAEISMRQDISLSFLEQLFAKLRRAGLVDSVRGANGGYVLARPADLIGIDAIMHAVDEDVMTKRCHDNGISCTGKGAKCLSHDLWQAMEDHIEGFFAAISIQDVLDQKFPELCPKQAETREKIEMPGAAE